MKTTTVTVTKIASKVVVPPPTYEIKLNISEREAKALFALANNVGGCPQLSARGLFDEIRYALETAGVSPEYHALKNAMETISFEKYSDYKKS